MTISLRQYTLSIPAGTVSAQFVTGELDWRFDGNQTRRFVVTLVNGSDSVLLEATLDEVNWFPLANAYTGNTTPNVLVTVGPFVRVRATKTGTNAAATVVAIA